MDSNKLLQPFISRSMRINTFLRLTFEYVIYEWNGGPDEASLCVMVETCPLNHESTHQFLCQHRGHTNVLGPRFSIASVIIHEGIVSKCPHKGCVCVCVCILKQWDTKKKEQQKERFVSNPHIFQWHCSTCATPSIYTCKCNTADILVIAVLCSTI